MDVSTGAPDWLQKQLTQHSTSRYYIEHTNYRFNHMAHGICALYYLGATAERIERFIEWYQERLEEPSAYEPTKENLINDLTQWKGNRRHFYALCEYYETQLKNKYKTLEKMIEEEFPKYSPGMAGQALHGIIHLGYGFATRSTKISCEAIAYMHGSYQAPTFSDPAICDIKKLGLGQNSFAEVLDMVRNDKELLDTVYTNANRFYDEKQRGEFGSRMKALFTRGDDLMKYVYMIRFPQFYDSASKDLTQIIELCNWILDTAIAVYAMTDRPNDFFLLHGVTGAWGLKQVLPLIHDYDLAIQSIQTFATILIAVYISVSTPKLSVRIDSNFTEEWKEIINKAMAQDVDTHIYKLIHVCQERSKEDDSVAPLCAFASNIAVTKSLSFLNRE